MWQEFPFFPEQASTVAGEVDALYLALVGMSAFFTIGIFIAILYFAVKYRRRPGNEVSAATSEWMGLELIWTTIPFAIAVSLLVWGMKIYVHMFEPPRDAIEIAVVGKQWMWKLQHPGGQAEINELHVPLGAKVLLRMATEDVIHSFFIPAFRVKQDVVPGRYTSVWFETTRVGEYHLFCAEYCGSKHSRMIGTVHVMERDRFQEWLRANEPDETILSAGERLFERHGCESCHRGADGRRGPALAGLHGSEVRLADGSRVRADDDYLRESIVRPMAKLVEGYRPLMPPFEGQISEEEVFHLLAYIKALDGPGAEARAVVP